MPLTGEAGGLEELKEEIMITDDQLPIIQPVLNVPNLLDDSSTYFGDSKTLRTPAHRNMVIQFVRDHYPKARFQRIYDAAIDGWKEYDFHRCCDKKGWTVTIVETTKDFIFGVFSTAEWESSPHGRNKAGPRSFMFSVNESIKYPVTRGDNTVIQCNIYCCALFGSAGDELVIASDSNKNIESYCEANRYCFKLPAAKGK
jgi:hypothetical protein